MVLHSKANANMDIAEVPEDLDLDKFVARVDFYESCVEQLKREIPRYLNRQHELDKTHKHLAKALKGIGSSEPNQKLRDVLFLYSQKHEQLSKEREIFGSCEKLTHELVEDARKLLIAPVKDIIADQRAVAKVSAAASSAAGSGTKASKSDMSDAEFVRSTLQVHAKMFEKHRLHNLRAVLQTLLRAELRYHCKAVEEVSEVLKELAAVDDTM